MNQSTPHIAAIIAAAGRSRRMGEPKQLLPWGESTVIATVVNNLATAGATPIYCVTGHRADEIASALTATPARICYNPQFTTTEMLRSYQTGINALLAHDEVRGTLLALGDQPHMPVATLAQVITQAEQSPDRIVIPSHNMRRGHPFYIPRPLWPEILALGEDETLRIILKRHETIITYVNVDDDAILRDMDTPEAYAALRQQAVDSEQ